jgi:hypothetical protein
MESRTVDVEGTRIEAYKDFLDSIFFYYGESARAAEKAPRSREEKMREEVPGPIRGPRLTKPISTPGSKRARKIGG